MKRLLPCILFLLVNNVLAQPATVANSIDAYAAAKNTDLLFVHTDKLLPIHDCRQTSLAEGHSTNKSYFLLLTSYFTHFEATYILTKQTLTYVTEMRLLSIDFSQKHCIQKIARTNWHTYMYIV